MIITKSDSITEQEAREYIDYLEKTHLRKLEKIDIQEDGEFVNLRYEFQKIPFERIRRITGYLVGSLDRWNTAKQAEESHRVKHGTGAMK